MDKLYNQTYFTYFSLNICLICTVKSVILLFNEQTNLSTRENGEQNMIFYAKDFSILPDSETAKKHDTVFSEMAKTGDKRQ